MSTCRFVRANLLEGATVLNGTAGSPTPPLRTEVAPFVMERALNRDRRSLWRLGAPNDLIYGGSYQLDLDAGASTTLSAISLHGLSCPGGEITTVAVGYMNSYPIPGSSYSQIDSASLSGSAARDVGFVFGPTSKRYWYIWIEATAAPVVGRVVGGEVFDLELAPNPGSQSSPFQNRLEQVQQDGSIQVHGLGYMGRDFSLTFEPIFSLLQRDRILALSEHQGSIVYFDPEGQCFETVVRGARVNNTRQTAGVHSVSLEMMRMP